MDPSQLDKTIHQRSRLAILAYLYRNRQAGFTTLRDELGLTGGNVSKHADKLEDAGYLVGGDVLTPDGFEKRYRITPEGEHAFEAYLEALEGIVGDPSEAPSPD